MGNAVRGFVALSAGKRSPRSSAPPQDDNSPLVCTKNKTDLEITRIEI
jgi:hypothetical protein